MAQTQTVPDPRLTVMNWQVVEFHPASTPWVIAQFDLEDDADAFAEAKAAQPTDCTYMVREDPAEVQRRTNADSARMYLRRRPEVTLELAGRDL